MDANFTKALGRLLSAFNPAIRTSIVRRFDAMHREFHFLRERRGRDLEYAVSKGWSDERFGVLFLFNCAYQIFVGPLQSSARNSVGLGDVIPIAHGADRFDRQRARNVNAMAADFVLLVDRLGFQRDWLTKNTCGDVIYWVARFERDRE